MGIARIRVVEVALRRSSLPLLAAPLLDRGGASAAGETTFPYLASFYNVRFTAAGFVFAAILTWGLPNPLWSRSRWHVRPLVMALGSAASGCLLWAAGVQLSDLGHGFPLACAVAGVGLLTLGLSELAEYATDSREFLVSGLAGWLRGSRMRGFMLGASFAFYGMFLRPLMYETLWFAGVYEWLAVLALAFWAMTQARSLLRPYVESAESAPVSWSGWNRHEQSFENRPDPRLNLLERWQRQFVESGEWADMWTYLTGLLCRNGASPTATGEVIRPIRDSVGPGAKLPLWRGGQKREEQNRRLALAHSLESIEGAMANRSAQQLNTRDPALSDLAGPYVETGQDPETVAAAVISAYHRRGADLDLAISLWFPMVDHVERPPRWFEPPWVRNRNRRRALDRRKRLVEAAVAHLAGEASVADLPVAVAATRMPAFFMLPGQDQEILPSDEGTAPAAGETGDNRHRYVSPIGSTQVFDVSRLPGAFQLGRGRQPQAPSSGAVPGSTSMGQSGFITAGQGLEILGETERAYVVRTPRMFQTQIFKASLRRHPILPGDGIEATE